MKVTDDSGAYSYYSFAIYNKLFTVAVLVFSHIFAVKRLANAIAITLLLDAKKNK